VSGELIIGALPYWRLDAKRRYLLPSSKPQPQSAATWCVQHSWVERCRTDDLMPNVAISCLPPSRMEPEVQRLKIITNKSRHTCFD